MFASSWPLNGETEVTIVNRNEYDLTGPQMELPYKQGLHYYDLWHGTELPAVRNGDHVVLSFDMAPHGYGAIFITPELKDSALMALMEKSKGWAATPLNSLSDAWKPLDQKVVEIAKTPASSTEPKGMVKVPAGDFRVPCRRDGDRGLQLGGTGRAVSVGGFSAQTSCAHAPYGQLLDRQVSGDEC